MKKTVIIMILAALCGLNSNASETTSQQTNFAQPLNIDFTVTIGGTASTADGVTVPSALRKRLTTADVIDALGTSLGANFSTNAQLLLALSGTGSFIVSVKDGAKAGVNVTGYFVFDPSSNYIESVSYRTNTGSLVTNFQAMETFGLQNGARAGTVPWHFTVAGLTQASYREIETGGTPSVQGFALNAQVSGSGDYGGVFALFEGVISSESAGAESDSRNQPDQTTNARANYSTSGVGRTKRAQTHAKQ
jgi:hypothetical protein